MKTHFLPFFEGKDAFLGTLNKEILDLEQHFGTDVESLVAQERYACIDRNIKQSCSVTILLSNQSILECNRRQRDVKASQIGSIFLTKSMYRDDIVKIS